MPGSRRFDLRSDPWVQRDVHGRRKLFLANHTLGWRVRNNAYSHYNRPVVVYRTRATEREVFRTVRNASAP